jgi:hypothetical protein
MHRHTFLGGNFFILRMLNRYRNDLGVGALASELDATASGIVRQLGTDTALVSIGRQTVSAGQLAFDVDVQNLSGHKLPTAYPSRRVWLHVSVRDTQGHMVFESGAIDARGAIAGDDFDADPTKIEPHYTEIRRPDEVQVYESVMGDSKNQPTTGLLQATSFLKDNRLLPQGFDKTTAEPEIAVRGSAMQDPDFSGGGDRVRYVVDTNGASGPFQVDAELRYQVISFRWADNLRSYNAPEPKRFVSYYDAMSSEASTVLARASQTMERGADPQTASR